jgi:hypothetical protein
MIIGLGVDLEGLKVGYCRKNLIVILGLEKDRI